MKFLGLLTVAILSGIAIADSPLDEQIFEIISLNTTRSSVPQTPSNALSLLKRATCQTTCPNGGCCNSGGPCTTDGMCCLAGEFACSDGGCCANGATCATVNGAQVCQSTVSCKAPIVPCGSACCDAGMVCLNVATQFRCEPAGSASNSTSTSSSSSTAAPAPTPQLGDSHRNSTISRLTTPSYNISTLTATWSVGDTLSMSQRPQTTTLTSGGTRTTELAAAATSSSSSSASMQSIFVFDLRYVVNFVGVAFLGAALLLIN